MIRLIRRSLLCLIVGVTAFGVAGWMLHPRPSWSIGLENDDSVKLLPGLPNTDGDEPVWVVRFDRKASAFDATSGRLIHTIDAPPDFTDHEFRRSSGAVALSSWRSDQFDLIGPTQIALFDAHHGRPSLARSFEGHAELCKDGRTAWCAKKEGDGLRFQVVEWETNRFLHTLTFDRGFRNAKAYDLAVSPDAKWLAIPKPLNATALSGATIELWDVEKGTLTRTIAPPPLDGVIVEIRSVKFSEDGREIEYRATDHTSLRHGRWNWCGRVYNLALNRHRSDQDGDSADCAPSPPADFSENAEPLKTDAAGFGELWSVRDEDRRIGAFGVFRAGKPTLDWRRIPFPVQIGPLVSYAVPDDVRVDESAKRPPFLVHCWKPPLRESIPENLQSFAPASLNIDKERECIYWHDWDRNSWLDVGITEGFTMQCLRKDSLITLGATDDGATILRSWTLPPRDPKWIAAVIGVISAAAVWWFCRRRAAKKMQSARGSPT